MLAARAAYIAGFAGTSLVEAARRLGIPASGTMAHSWVQAFATEPEAFAAFARVFPESTSLLVDTYDTMEGVRHAASIEPPVKAIRIDSGDMATLSKEACPPRSTRAVFGQDHALWRPGRVQNRSDRGRGCAG